MCNEYCERWRKHTKTSQWHLFPAHCRSNQINSLVLLVTVNEENKEVNVWNTWWDIVGVLKPHLHWKLVHTRHPHQVQHNCWTWQHFFLLKETFKTSSTYLLISFYEKAISRLNLNWPYVTHRLWEEKGKWQSPVLSKKKDGAIFNPAEHLCGSKCRLSLSQNPTQLRKKYSFWFRDQPKCWRENTE